MKTMIRIISRTFWSVVFIIWLVTLMDILENDKYVTFLRPEFGIFIALGAFTLFCFFISSVREAETKEIDARQIMYGLILLLPLPYLMNAQDVHLGSYALQKRSVGVPSINITSGKSIKKSSSDVADRKADRKNEKSSPHKKRPKIKEVTIVELYDSGDAYKGKRVSLLGMVHKNDPQIRKEFGKEFLVVFRFVINCCAADAMPVAVLVDGRKLPDLPEESWVRVEGDLKILNQDDARIPILEKSSIKMVDPPKQPYLY